MAKDHERSDHAAVPRSGPGVGTGVRDRKSTVSEHFIEASRRRLDNLRARRLEQYALCAMMIDGTCFDGQDARGATALIAVECAAAAGCSSRRSSTSTRPDSAASRFPWSASTFRSRSVMPSLKAANPRGGSVCIPRMCPNQPRLQIEQVLLRRHRVVRAHIGHRSEKYTEFGWAAARLDDWITCPPRASRRC